MGASSYPGMTQPFSMSHSSNMSSVGVRQDSMSEYFYHRRLIEPMMDENLKPIFTMDQR